MRLGGVRWLAAAVAAAGLAGGAWGADLGIARVGADGRQSAGADVKAAPYTIIRLSADNVDPDAAVVWDVTPEDAVSFDDRTDNILAFTAPPGTYRVRLLTIKGKEVKKARTTVVIGDSVPPAPPVDPSDPFFLTLQTAYAAEPSAGKAAQARQLAAVFQVAGTTTANDPALTTTGGLVAKVHAAAESVVSGLLPGVRDAIKTELNTKLPRDPAAALTPALRSTIAGQFNRMAGLLNAVK
jgi:hypothetical protein